MLMRPLRCIPVDVSVSRWTAGAGASPDLLTFVVFGATRRLPYHVNTLNPDIISTPIKFIVSKKAERHCDSNLRNSSAVQFL